MVTKDDLYVMVLNYDTKYSIAPFDRNTIAANGPIGPSRFVVFTEKRAQATAKEWTEMYGTELKRAMVMPLGEFLKQWDPVPEVA